MLSLSSLFTHRQAAPQYDAAQLERKLLCDAQNGNSDAFGELYQQHAETIYGFCYRRLQDVDEARNLTHLVFLRAWQSLPKYQSKGVPFLHWLYRIANACTIDHLRRVRPVVALTDEQLTAEAVTEFEPTPEQALLTKERSQLVQSALAQLNDTYQQVLILRFQQNLSHAEVAEILGKQVGTVRILQMRALQALAKVLATFGIAEA